MVRNEPVTTAPGSDSTAPAQVTEPSAAPAPAAASPAAPGSAAAVSTPTPRSAAGHAPAAAPAVEGPATQEVAGPEAAAFTALMATRRAELIAVDEQRRTRVTDAATAGKQDFRAQVAVAAAAVESVHDEVIAGIRERSAADQGTIRAALQRALEKVDAAAETELAAVTGAVDGNRKAVQEAAKTRADEATGLGDQHAARAVDGSAQHGRAAAEIRDRKIAQYQNADKGSEIAQTIRTQATKLVSGLGETGRKAAGEVRRKAAELAGKFRSEGGEAAAGLAGPGRDARARIIQVRDDAKKALRDMARVATTKIAESEATAIGNVRRGRADAVAAVREAAPGMDATLDQAATAATTKLSQHAATMAQDLGEVVTTIAENGWHPPFLLQAQSEVEAALTGQQSDLDGFADRVAGGIGETASTAATQLGVQRDTAAGAVRKLGTDFATASGQAVAQVGGKMDEASGTAVRGMQQVAPAVAEKLTGAVKDIDGRWAGQLTEHGGKFSAQVDEALAGEARAVSGLASSIDQGAAKVTSGGGFFSSLFDFVVGAFEGLFLGAWDLLKGLWEAIKTPLFWIVVAVAVVLIAVAVIAVMLIGGLALGAALIAVLKVVGTILLVIGVIAGVLMAGYYLYLMFTKPDLSWRERGRLLGRAVFELVLAFAGTGILKRLGVLAQVAKLRRFVALVGGVSKALRLIHLLPDLEKLIVLMGKVGEAEKLIVLLEKVKDAELLIKLLEKAKDADLLIELLGEVKNAETLLKLLSSAKIPDALALKRLLTHPKIRSLASLEKILDDAKIADFAELLALLDNAKIADADQLVRLLERCQSGAQLRELLALPAFADGAALEHLADVLARAGWPEAIRAGELAGPKLAQLADPVILAEIEATLAAQEAGQIAGMRDWLLFNGKKAPAELVEAAAELRDARQLASENPGQVVRVGREQRAPLRPGTVDERLPEFDLAVETPGGALTAVVEVTSVDGKVSQVSDLSNGVRHAADKVAARLGTPTPVRGSPQALIHMTLDVGRKQMRGTIREILPDGTVNILRNDGTLIKSSNFFDDVAGNLAALKNNTLLDRVTLVDQTGRRIVYVRQGSTWTRL